MNKFKENLGKIFSVLTAITSLTCLPCLLFPLLIGIGAGSIATHVAVLTKSFLIIFIMFAIFGFILKFKNHRNAAPLILSFIGGTTIYYFYLVKHSKPGIRIGSLFMILAAISDMFFKKYKKCKCK